MQRIDLLFKYQMQSFNFHVNLHKAKEIMPIFQPIDNHQNHWNKYTNQLTVYDVPGDHETMFLKPNVIALAHKFKSSLNLRKRSDIRSSQY